MSVQDHVPCRVLVALPMGRTGAVEPFEPPHQLCLTLGGYSTPALCYGPWLSELGTFSSPKSSYGCTDSRRVLGVMVCTTSSLSKGDLFR